MDIILIAGRKCAGKDSARKVIEAVLEEDEIPFVGLSFSTPLEPILDARGLPHTRSNFIKVADEKTDRYGQRWFLRVLAMMLRKEAARGTKCAVVCGARHLEDLAVLRHGMHTHMIFVETSFENRFARAKGHLKDFGLTEKAFREQDGAPTEASIDMLRAHADSVIFNDGTLTELMCAVLNDFWDWRRAIVREDLR